MSRPVKRKCEPACEATVQIINYLNNIRLKNKTSYRELADKTKMSYMSIWFTFTHKTNPSADMLIRLSAALGCTLTIKRNEEK